MHGIEFADSAIEKQKNLLAIHLLCIYHLCIIYQSITYQPIHQLSTFCYILTCLLSCVSSISCYLSNSSIHSIICLAIHPFYHLSIIYLSSTTYQLSIVYDTTIYKQTDIPQNHWMQRTVRPP